MPVGTLILFRLLYYMLVIRLQRAGRKHLPFYRIVVAEKSSPVKGRYVERIGSYNPVTNPKEVVLDQEAFTKYVGNGAVPSPTVARIAAAQGVNGLEKFIPKRIMKPSNAQVAAAAAKAEAEAAAKAEAEEKAAAEAAAKAEAAAAAEAQAATDETPTETAEEKKEETAA